MIDAFGKSRDTLRQIVIVLFTIPSSGRDCIIDTECSLSFSVTSLNTVIEYHVRVREYNLTAEEYGNLTIISVKPSTEGAEGDEFSDQVLITSKSWPRVVMAT